MELQKALKEVREQKIAPVYLLIGTELYLTELFKTCLLYTSPSPRDRG